MAEDKEPTGGLKLFDAFHSYTDPEKIRAARQADDDAGNVLDVVARGVVDRNNPSVQQAISRAKNAERAALLDFWERFRSGELVAWGAERSPTADRRPIPKHAWRHLTPGNWRASVLKGPEGLRIYAVSVIRASPSSDRQVTSRTKGEATDERVEEAKPAQVERIVRRPGRPSRAHEIDAAFHRLLDLGEIDFKAPQIHTIRKVRDEVMLDSGNRNSTGLGNEVIRKHIAADFQAEKRNRIRAP